MEMQFDRAKFKEMVHYICSVCAPNELGFVKLHKALYYADMLHYAEYRAPISGETYQKQKHGPIAKHLWETIQDLEKDGKLEVRFHNYHGYQKKEFVSLKKWQLDKLSKAEIELIDEVINFVCRKNTARSISELSHEGPWKVARMGEDLPYYTVFSLFPEDITPEDMEWALGEKEKIENLSRSTNTL